MSNSEYEQPPIRVFTLGDYLANATATLNPSVEDGSPQLENDSNNHSADSDLAIDLNASSNADSEFNSEFNSEFESGFDFEKYLNMNPQMENFQAAWVPRVYCTKLTGCVADNHYTHWEHQLEWKYDCKDVVQGYGDELIRRLQVFKEQERDIPRGYGNPQGYNTERGVKKVAWFTDKMLLMVRTPRGGRDRSRAPSMVAAVLLERLNELAFMEPGSKFTKPDGAEYWFECVGSHM